jgi:hypothetical protein
LNNKAPFYRWNRNMAWDDAGLSHQSVPSEFAGRVWHFLALHGKWSSLERAEVTEK